MLKRLLFPRSREAVFHVSIQPCFDKKLEASRLDFFHEGNSLLSVSSNEAISISRFFETLIDDQVKEVDLVLSTAELYELLLKAAEKAYELNSDFIEKSSEDRVVLDFLQGICMLTFLLIFRQLVSHMSYRSRGGPASARAGRY